MEGAIKFVLSFLIGWVTKGIGLSMMKDRFAENDDHRCRQGKVTSLAYSMVLSQV